MTTEEKAQAWKSTRAAATRGEPWEASDVIAAYIAGAEAERERCLAIALTVSESMRIADAIERGEP